MASSRASILFAIAVAFASACNSPASALPTSEPSAQGPRRVIVDPETVKRLGIVSAKVGEGAGVPTIAVPGTIEYDLDRYAEVGPRLDGRVTAVRAKLGDAVKKGQLLAELAVPSLAEAQASFLVASATLGAAKKNASRENDLLAKQLTTAREAEVAETDLRRAEADVAAAKARLDALGAPGRGIGGTIRLVAPIDGTIVQRTAVLGGHLSASQNAFVVADVSKLVATLDVHEADLPYVKLDAEVSFTADGLPGRTFKGKLFYVDPVVGKATRVVRAKVAVDNPETDGAPTLRPGMFVRAGITIGDQAAKTAAIALPPAAVQPLGNDDVVFLESTPGTYEVRPVRIARRTSEVVEVSSGLARGDRIVVEGAFLLRGEAAKR